MKEFGYQRAHDVTGAVALLAADPDARYLGGGTNLVDTMKLDVSRPEVVIDLNGLGETGLRRIEVTDAGIRFGALVRMADAEQHEVVRRRFPVITESLTLAASPQIRNMASLAGNLLQRTR